MDTKTDRKIKKARKWIRYGFVPAEGYTSLCKHCNKTLSNSRITRMILHRRACAVYKQDFTYEIPSVNKIKPPSKVHKNSDCLTERRSDNFVEEEQGVCISQLVDVNNACKTSQRTQNGNDPIIEEECVSPILNSLLVAVEDCNDSEEFSDIEQKCCHISNDLHKELITAKTEYLRVKAQYYDKLSENEKLRRTTLILNAKKTNLEILRLKKNANAC